MTIHLTGSMWPDGSLPARTVEKHRLFLPAAVAFKQLINPTAGVTGGNFRNLHVEIPEISVFNAQEPEKARRVVLY